MRKIVFCAALAAAAAACYPGGTRITRHRFVPGVEVPRTPEGGACQRECMALLRADCSIEPVKQTSIDQRKRSLEVTVTTFAAGPNTERFGCAGLYADCLMTCPGAAEVDGGPRIETSTTGGDPDDDKDTAEDEGDDE